MGHLTWSGSVPTPFLVVVGALCFTPAAVRTLDLRLPGRDDEAIPAGIAWRYFWAGVTGAASALVLGFAGMVGALLCIVTVPAAIAVLALGFTGVGRGMSGRVAVMAQAMFLGPAIALTNIDERPLLAVACLMCTGAATAWMVWVRASSAPASAPGS